MEKAQIRGKEKRDIVFSLAFASPKISLFSTCTCRFLGVKQQQQHHPCSHVAVMVLKWTMVWSLLAVLAMICPMHTGSQHLPTRDEDHFHFQINHAEIFYDTKLLPDGAEAVTYLFNGTMRRCRINRKFGLSHPEPPVLHS